MQQKIFNKLVRDKIPANLKAKGITTVTSRAKEEDMPMYLGKKLAEEVKEFLEAPESTAIHELADIIEVTRESLIRYGAKKRTAELDSFCSENLSRLNLVQAKEILSDLASVTCRETTLPEDKALLLNEIEIIAYGCGAKLGYSEAELDTIITRKSEQNGGFKNNIILHRTLEK